MPIVKIHQYTENISVEYIKQHSMIKLYLQYEVVILILLQLFILSLLFRCKKLEHGLDGLNACLSADRDFHGSGIYEVIKNRELFIKRIRKRQETIMYFLICRKNIRTELAEVLSLQSVLSPAFGGTSCVQKYLWAHGRQATGQV